MAIERVAGGLESGAGCPSSWSTPCPLPNLPAALRVSGMLCLSHVLILFSSHLSLFCGSPTAGCKALTHPFNAT